MNGRSIAAGLVLAALTACGGGRTDTANEAAAARPTPQNNAQAAVLALPEGQRNGVLFRAIRDANLQCQNVTRSTLAQQSTEQLPVFVATCDNGVDHPISITADGTAVIQSPGQAR